MTLIKFYQTFKDGTDLFVLFPWYFSHPVTSSVCILLVLCSVSLNYILVCQNSLIARPEKLSSFWTTAVTCVLFECGI